MRQLLSLLDSHDLLIITQVNMLLDFCSTGMNFEQDRPSSVGSPCMNDVGALGCIGDNLG